MSEITWAELTEGERKILGNPKDTNYGAIESWNRLHDMGLIEQRAAYFGSEEGYRPYWSATDLGRAVLAQAAAEPDSGATGAKNAQVEAGDSLPPVTQEEINAYLKSQGQDPETLADAFRPAIEKAIRERQKILDELVAPVAKEEKRGLALEWFFGFDGALACLELVANGSHWQQWQQHRTDTRGIVTERAGKYLRKLQAELASAKAEAAGLRAAATRAYNCLDTVYETFDGDLGNGLSQAIPRVCEEIKAALQAGTEGG